MDWQEANKWEANWWGDCVHTAYEEIKQTTYARLMGLDLDRGNLDGKSVLDIGGGPVSLLLKFKNKGACVVVDPLPVPGWVITRYQEHNIEYANKKAEDYDPGPERVFDECWMYNCLQHVDDPFTIVKTMRKASRLIRVFEWVDMPISPGHIHTLREPILNMWLKGDGKPEFINENGCVGRCYYGIFKGDHYGEP